MIFPDLSYGDLHSYYYNNDELSGVSSHIFDLFFTILNIDIQNNYDRKDIILPLHFLKVLDLLLDLRYPVVALLKAEFHTPLLPRNFLIDDQCMEKAAVVDLVAGESCR